MTRHRSTLAMALLLPVVSLSDVAVAADGDSEPAQPARSEASPPARGEPKASGDRTASRPARSEAKPSGDRTGSPTEEVPIKTWSEAESGSPPAPTYMAEGVIDAPPAAVWALVSKCGDYVKNMPNIVASQELSREGDDRSTFTTVCQVTADVPFPFSDLTSVTKATCTVDAQNGSYTRAWTLVRGDYEVNDGTWRLVAVDGGAKTRLTYRIRVKPKLALPDSLIARSQKQTLPQIIQYLRDRTLKQP